MIKLNKKANELIQKLNCKIDFKWVKRDQNKKADSLASKASHMPQPHSQSIIKKDNIVQFKSNPEYVLEKSLFNNLPTCNCSKDIIRINNLGDKIRLKDLINLKSKGIDGYSRKDIDYLKECVEIRFGKENVIWLEQIVGNTSKYATSVFKWTARGLFPDLALKKVYIDVEGLKQL